MNIFRSKLRPLSDLFAELDGYLLQDGREAIARIRGRNGDLGAAKKAIPMLGAIITLMRQNGNKKRAAEIRDVRRQFERHASGEEA